MHHCSRCNSFVLFLRGDKVDKMQFNLNWILFFSFTIKLFPILWLIFILLQTVSTWVGATPTDWGRTNVARHIYFLNCSHTHKGLFRLKTPQRSSGLFPKVAVLPKPACKTCGRGACGGRRGEVCTSTPVWGDLWLDQTKGVRGCTRAETLGEQRFTICSLGHNSKFTLTYITSGIT